jgi:hypothetical protein
VYWGIVLTSHFVGDGYTFLVMLHLSLFQSLYVFVLPLEGTYVGEGRVVLAARTTQRRPLL